MSKQKRFLPLVVAVLICALAGAIAVGCSGGGASSTIPRDAKDALQDAAACADDLVARYTSYGDAAKSGGSQEDTVNAVGSSVDGVASESAADVVGKGKTPVDSGDSKDGSASAESADSTDSAGDETASEGRTYEAVSAEINDDIARLQADIDAVQKADGTWEGREEAVAAMQNLQGALGYELDIFEAQNAASKAPEGEKGMTAAMVTIAALYDGYNAITPPDCLKEYLKNTLDTMPTIYAALKYSLSAPSSTLSQYSAQELLTWWFTKQYAYDAECNDILVQQCQASSDMLKGVADGKAEASKPSVKADLIDEVAPNLYPSYDSAVNLGITSYDDAHSVLVEVEAVGFSQKFEQKYDLAQGYNYFPIKPAVLPANSLPNLSGNTTTQLNVKVTDADSGEVLLQESHPIELLSIYDFSWNNDEFGKTASFDILAWLRPQADEVNAVNRAAAELLGSWTGGAYQELAGYQYDDDVSATLIQVMAIQKAISDKGVTYVSDSYSFKSNQHVLTPDAVVRKQQGLCIETTLLMASCLMSANMHPLIIITPSHAQVAVESYANSGKYFLIETTTLPFSGFNANTDFNDPAFYNGLLPSVKTKTGERYYWTTSGSSEEWKTYFDYVSDSTRQFGGVFVIDCNLQQIMDIQGLENI